MELTRSTDKATDKGSNIPAQMHTRHPIFRVLPYFSTTLTSLFPLRPWESESVPIDHHQRMWFTMQHSAMTAD